MKTNDNKPKLELMLKIRFNKNITSPCIDSHQGKKKKKIPEVHLWKVISYSVVCLFSVSDSYLQELHNVSLFIVLFKKIIIIQWRSKYVSCQRDGFPFQHGTSVDVFAFFPVRLTARARSVPRYRALGNPRCGEDSRRSWEC